VTNPSFVQINRNFRDPSARFVIFPVFSEKTLVSGAIRFIAAVLYNAPTVFFCSRCDYFHYPV